ncbi:MAG: hypothetical protein O3B09_04610, partial [Proteobacteria bacterium]|nr:hypothetical protein [Pseudomonadota bacterium]
MIKNQLNFRRSLALIITSIFLYSCEQGCVETYEFGGIGAGGVGGASVLIDSYPVSDGIRGSGYNNITGGEVANWHSPGLRINGEQINVLIMGAWTGWDDAVNEESLYDLDSCTICAKLTLGDGTVIPNCICQEDQESESEPTAEGRAGTNDCSNSEADNQNDPSKCTCTTQHGTVAENFNKIHYLALDYQNKDGTPFTDGTQQKSCRYDKGMGLYAGAFGRDGNVIPKNIYHLYTTDSYCLLGSENDEG